MMSEEHDIFDLFNAPTWAPLHAKESDVSLEGFFPELPELTEIPTRDFVEDNKENLENISRLAMFRNRPQIKRRSQIRKEETAAKSDATVKDKSKQSAGRRSQSVSNNTSSKPSMKRANSSKSLPIVSRPALPPPVCAIRKLAKTPVQTRSRTMTRNSEITSQRAVAPSPIPSQREFNNALRSRPASLGKSGVVVQSTPRNTGKRMPSTGKQSIPKLQLPPQPTNKTQPTLPIPARTRVRAPISVNSSPVTLAFGSVVKPKPVAPRSSVILQQSERALTPTSRTPWNLRSYPIPSGVTPARGLTVPKTPALLRRASRDSNRIDEELRKQAIVERLYQPKKVVPEVSIYQTPARTIPNTFTHGMLSAEKSRRRITINQDK